MIKHTLTRIPKNIRKETAILTILAMIIAVGTDAFSFFLQFGKNQIASGKIIFGLVFITLYYIQHALDASVSLWMDDISATYKDHYATTIDSLVANVLLKVRGKVWRVNKKTMAREMLSTNSILLSCKNYISLVWDYKTSLAKNILQIISVICMFVGFIAVTSVEIKHILLFAIIITVVSALSIVFCIARLKLKNRFRESRKSYSEEKEMALNDVLNIEPINSDHANYMANKFIIARKEIFKFDKKDRKGLNKVNFLESIVDSLATIAIIALKVYEGGLQNIDLTFVLSIVALVSIYSQIMNRVTSIIYMAEDFKGRFMEMKTYESDFQEIIKVLDSDEITSETFGILNKVIVPEFSIKYEALHSETPFSLINREQIELFPGDIVLLSGPTGSGKSTFIKMVTRMIKFNGFELYFDRAKNGHIPSLVHQTDGRLGFSPVLSEITLGKNPDEDKIITILKGLHLYEEIFEKDNNVLHYLENSTIQSFSTGQKQRLAIARLLYNLDDSIQIIGFDEATNALNDAITLQTLNFIKGYCKNKILLIATHQVELGETVATKKFEFISNGTEYEIRKY